MLKKRLIPCLVLRDNLIVQSIGFGTYLPIGRAEIAVEFVANWDVDEIFLVDITATREGRPPNTSIVSSVSRDCFVPLTYGGGIRTLEHVRSVLEAGADKVSVNTACFTDPAFVSKASKAFGVQCIVASVDVKSGSKGRPEVMQGDGHKATGKDPAEWARQVEDMGAGEIFLNSVDRDGTKKGYDIELVQEIASAVKIPVIACGGVGKLQDFVDGILLGGASAVSAANIFQYTEHSTILAKAKLKTAGVDIRLNTAAKYDNVGFDEHGRLLKRGQDDLESIWFEKHQLEEI